MAKQMYLDGTVEESDKIVAVPSTKFNASKPVKDEHELRVLIGKDRILVSVSVPIKKLSMKNEERVLKHLKINALHMSKIIKILDGESDDDV